MPKKTEYKFDNELNILFKTYYGPIKVEDIRNSWQEAFDGGLIPGETRGYILDYRSARFDIQLEEYSAIPGFYREHLDYFGNKRIAIITDDPADIVIPILVKAMDNGYSSREFTTREAAIEWVLGN